MGDSQQHQQQSDHRSHQIWCLYKLAQTMGCKTHTTVKTAFLDSSHIGIGGLRGPDAPEKYRSLKLNTTTVFHSF